MLSDVKAIVFDLDGTLYTNTGLGREINRSAARYIARLKNLGVDEAAALIQGARERLTAESGTETPLTLACSELGGDIRDLHRHFADEIRPERYLRRDEGVADLLKILSTRYDLFLYTNNNRKLSSEITKLLGVNRFFNRVFTIEDSWLPKPDRTALLKVYHEMGRKPSECLFVGDRYDVDLREPANMGSAVFLAKTRDDLLALISVMK